MDGIPSVEDFAHLDIRELSQLGQQHIQEGSYSLLEAYSVKDALDAREIPTARPDLAVRRYFASKRLGHAIEGLLHSS